MTTSPTMKVRVPILDVWVTPMTASDVVSVIARRPEAPRLILNHNLHSAYLYHDDLWFKQFYELSDLIVIDGWPVFMLASRSRALSSAYRIGSTDWIGALWATRDLDPMRVFILGGSEQVNADAISAWRKRRSTDSVAGRSGYLTPSEEQGVIDMIREHDP